MNLNCKKDNNELQLTKAGVNQNSPSVLQHDTTIVSANGGYVLTFDDCFIDEWYDLLPILDSFNAKATFYISGFDHYTEDQILKLKIIQDHGNEIGYHTLNHYYLSKYLKNHTMAEYLRNEIDLGVKMMNNAGFFPTSFAFPFGDCTDSSTVALLTRFQSVRTANGITNMFIRKTRKTNEFNAYGIDNAYSPVMKDVFRNLKISKEINEPVVYLCHQVIHHYHENGYAASHERLIEIIQKAKEFGVPSFTVSQAFRISPKQ